MSEDRRAIRELLNSAIVACLECRDEQAMGLLREAIANIEITYGDENASPVLISLMIEMHEESQTKFLSLWRRLKQETASQS